MKQQTFFFLSSSSSFFFSFCLFLPFSGGKKKDYLFGNSPWTLSRGRGGKWMTKRGGGGKRQERRRRRMTVGGGGRLGTHAYSVTVGLALIKSSWGDVYLLWCAHLFTQWHLLDPQQKVAGSLGNPPLSLSLCLRFHWAKRKFLSGWTTLFWRGSWNSSRWSAISHLILACCFSASSRTLTWRVLMLTCDDHANPCRHRFVLPAH